MSRYGYIVHSELAHHGIKGQKWGVRRYENADGTLTEAGKERYGYKGGSKKYSHTPWDEAFNTSECTFIDSKNKAYEIRIENLNRGDDKSLKKVQQTLSDMIDDDFINDVKEQVSSYIAGSYDPEEFGLNNIKDKHKFKQYIYNNIDIEGISSSADIRLKGGSNMKSYEGTDFGIDFSFDGIPFMNDNDGVLDLTNKKIRDIGYPYPD